MLLHMIGSLVRHLPYIQRVLLPLLVLKITLYHPFLHPLFVNVNLWVHACPDTYMFLSEAVLCVWWLPATCICLLAPPQMLLFLLWVCDPRVGLVETRQAVHVQYLQTPGYNICSTAKKWNHRRSCKWCFSLLQDIGLVTLGMNYDCDCGIDHIGSSCFLSSSAALAGCRPEGAWRTGAVLLAVASSAFSNRMAVRYE